MTQSKLLRLLRKLEDAERDRFFSLVSAPFFNTNRNLTALLGYLMAFAPEFDSDQLNAKNAFGYVFPNEKEPAEGAVRVITKLSSKILALLMQYIEIESINSDPFIHLNLRKNWFNAKGLLDWEQATLQQMKDNHIHNTVFDLNHHQQSYLLELEHIKNEVSKQLITEHINFEQLNQALDEYYLRAKLEVLCQMANHAMISRQVYPMSELRGVDIIFEAEEKSLKPTTKIWYAALKLLTKPNDFSLYTTLLDDLRINASALSTKDQRVIVHFLTNCTRLASDDPEVYGRRMFDLYKLQIEKDLLRAYGYLQPETFYNVVNVAINVRELDWAGHFFEENQHFLNPLNEKTPDIKAMCKAIILFEQGKFSEAMDFLNNLNFKDRQFKITEKRIRAKLLYELGMTLTLVDHLNAFRKYLSINAAYIASHHVEGCRNFINFTFQVCIEAVKSHKSLEAIRSKINDTPILPERHWLQEKIGIKKYRRIFTNAPV